MQRIRAEIRGIVQGVGFRPFIHRLVRDHHLLGCIRNTSSGVTLELEGEEADLAAFLQDLPEQAPPLSVIEEIRTETMDGLAGYTAFSIEASERQWERRTLISPDVAVCPDCLRELRDPADRRYLFPFINCTNCGPRFTIIEDVPYDRARTSMKKFPMCSKCRTEYEDIEDRRYHAQPDCCPDCGPSLVFLDAEGREQPGDAIANAREVLKAGKILAVKGLGGIHLACRCDDPAFAERLRSRKHRDEKPFAVMCRDVEQARKICEVSPEEEAILNGARKPIVLLRKKAPGMEHISENGFIGVMLPYTPLHVILFGDDLDLLIMTSANISDLPILSRNEDAVRKLQGIADAFLLHNRDIQTRCDDSLCWVVNGKEYFARRSRGYVPQPVTIPERTHAVLACGAEQKASFCISKRGHAFPSQHIGDLKNWETMEHYTAQIKHFENLFDLKPEALACDLHPDYLSTAYAEERAAKENIPLFRIQHHHAHMAACMADRGLDGDVIGLIWDGTGLGTDGTIWGAECLVGGYAHADRKGSILPIALPGGDLVTTEVSRTAFSLLKAAGCSTDHIANAEALEKQLAAGLNCPLSSGMGRLFDGVAAILGIKTRCSYEGQAAILLEAAVTPCNGVYPYRLEGSPPRFDWRETIASIVEEKEKGVPVGMIAARFHNTLLDMAAVLCERAAEESGLNRVVLSGGTFQNQILVQRLPPLLREKGLEVYLHQRVSPNDEGLSLGQLMIADARMREQE